MDEVDVELQSPSSTGSPVIGATSPPVLTAMATTEDAFYSGKANRNLDPLESLVQRDLDAASRRLHQLRYVHHKVDADKVAKKIIQGTSSALKFLTGLAEAHPIASGVVKAVSVVVNLECQRHENDAHIATVHTSMLNAVFHLRFLNHESRGTHKDGPSLDAAMKELCKAMADTIHAFGAFVDSYHGHWQRTVKFVFSYVLRKKLEDFSQEFDKLLRDMDNIYRSTMQIQLATVVTNTTEILRRLSFNDPDAHQLKHLVPRKEGDDAALRSNPEHIKKVTVQMKEKLTHTVRCALQEDYETHLQRNAARYRMKCESVERQVFLFSERQAVRIGGGRPHQLIEDKELQGLWSGLHEYYQGHFPVSQPGDTSISDEQLQIVTSGRQPQTVRSGERPQSVPTSSEQSQAITSSERPAAVALGGQPATATSSEQPQALTAEDAWTLEYFSRAMYYAAIGDIIDDDGSGYISALELNIFLKSERCLRKWTKPQWFAFWASGWHNNNAWYHDEIDRMMRDLLNVLHEASPDSRDAQWRNIKNMLQSLRPLILVMDNEESSSAGVNHVPHQLRELQEEFRQHEEEVISGKLHQFGTHLTDSASIVAVVGDARIELHIMPLVYILIKLLNDLVAKVANQRLRSSEDMCEIEALAMSCITVFVAFDSRLRDLSRGWRLEAKDIGMQVDRYADGLFRKYYAQPWVFHKAYDDLRRCMFGEEYELPLHLRPVMRTQLSAPADAVAMLNQRVEALERRVFPFSAGIRKFRGFWQRIWARKAEQEGKGDGDDWLTALW